MCPSSRAVIIGLLTSLLWVVPLRAQDFEFEARTAPAPPWNAFQQVRFDMRFQNLGEVPVRVRVEFVDMTRLDELVERFEPVGDAPESCAFAIAPWCNELSPVPWVFFWCHLTPPVPAGETLSCSYDVIAFAGADGTRTATVTATPLVMPPGATPPTYQSVERNVVFGYGLRPVPALGAPALLVLVLAILGVAAARSRRL